MQDACIQTRLCAKKRGAEIYPAYEHIRAAKAACYPKGINVSDIGATISL